MSRLALILAIACLVSGAHAQNSKEPPRPASFYDTLQPYAKRIGDAVKFNLIMTEPVDPESRVEVEIFVTPDGSVSSFNVLSSKGAPEWLTAVRRAMVRTDKLPLDSSGNIPFRMVLTFRP